MNSMNGNLHMLYHAAVFTVGKVLFIFITLPLMAAWLMIGFVFDLSPDVVTGISIPVYINLIIIVITGFKSLFPAAVGLGSTRVQFLKSYYIAGFGVVLFTMFMLNVFQFVLMVLFEQFFGWSSILHPAVLFVEGYHFIPYLWIDLMVGMFLYWFSFLFYCIWYRIGTTRSLILLTVLIIGGLFLYYGGILGSWWLWFSAQNMQALATFSLLGFVSLLAMLATYPLMLDAPLQPAPGS